jgi:3-deoxy-D-manno-octulosonic acid (KDO) 8-phosphate synthase
MIAQVEAAVGLMYACRGHVVVTGMGKAGLVGQKLVAYGVSGLFCEVHPEPDRALSDGANSLRLDMVDQLLSEVLTVRQPLRKEDRSASCGP